MRAACLLLAVALATPAAAQAGDARVATRAGTAAEAAIDLARQTGTSIVIADPEVARRRVPAMRGTLDLAEAVDRLARAAGARAVRAGSAGWRIEAAPSVAPVRPAPARATPRPRPEAIPPEPPPPPIVVVASKRDLRLQQLAGQASILDGAALEAGGVGGTEKITQRLATVSSTHLGSGRNKLFIRGIADSSFTGPTQATVGQYLGDLRLTYNAPDPDLRLSDLERVEVLEGPQGTLYGAGSLGGIIRLVPREPSPGETLASIRAGGALTQHGAASGDASATVNLPIAGETTTLRATFDAASLGGYIDKPRLGREDVNRTRTLGGRAIVRIDPGAGWSVDLIALGQTTDSADSQYADRDGPPLTSSARVREGSDADYALGQVVISGQIGALRLRSTTGLVRQHLRERYDASPAGGPTRLFAQANDTRMLAHETRVWQPERGGFGWIAGASFTHNRTVLTRRFDTTIRDSTATLKAAATGVRNEIDEATLYGEASLRVTGPLVATAGGRLTHSRLGGTGEDVLPAIALARADVTASRSTTTFLPSFAVHAEMAAQTALYLRYQEGFRPGGFAVEGDFVRRFRNDHTATFEVGARHGRPGSGPFDLAFSVSYTRWRDIQADFIDSFGLPSTANIGDGRIWSASLTGGVSVAPGLRLDAGLTWNRSRVDEPPLTFAARTRQVPNIAHVAGRAGVDWTRSLGPGLQLSARGWASYVGRSRLGIGPELGEPQGDYLDSGLELRLGGEKRGLSLSVTNLADERGNRFSLGTPFSEGRDQITPLRPRTVRLGFDASF